MKKTILTLAMLAALLEMNAQSIDSTKTAKDRINIPIIQTEATKVAQVDAKKDPAPVDNFMGNIEIIVGSNKIIPPNKISYNTYVRPNIFYNLPFGISGYDWTEVYTDMTIFGRNTLSKTIATIFGTKDKPKLTIGLENQFLYNTEGLWGIEGTTHTGLGIDITYTPTKDISIKPYFTPCLINNKGKIEENTSITGVYFTAKPFPNNNVLKNMTVSGFGEMNFSAKIDENDNGTTKDNKLKPTWSYGEVCIGYAIPSITDVTQNSQFTVEYVPSLTCKGQGKAAPQVNHRIGVVYNF